MQKVSRGLTRLWIVLFGFVELCIALVGIASVVDWAEAQPYVHAGDPLTVVVFPFVLAMLVVGAFGYMTWLAGLWVVRGFIE